MSTQAAHDRFLARSGARLRWQLEGTGPALVLLHGWALDLNYWDAAVARLARDFTVLRFDRRGFGLSQGTPDPAQGVGDLAALLEAAGLDRVVLVGMSQGARLAIRFAAAQPARVRALVLDGAPALEGEPELPIGEYRRLLTGPGPTALHAALLTHPLMRLNTRDAPTLQALRASIGRYRGLDLLQAAPALPPPDLRALRMPVLVLNGSLDTAERRAAGLSLQQTLAMARHVELQGAGHLALLDDPDGYVRQVAGFAANLPR